jgi:hypothetical protein
MRGFIKSTGLLGSLSVALMGALSGCGAGTEEPDGGDEAAAIDDTARSGAVQALRTAFPKARLQSVGNTIERVFGSRLSTGATPEAAIERFLADHAGAFGADSADLKPALPEGGRAIPSPAAGPLGLMFDKATGKYRYYLYRYGQERNGLRVHKSTLLALVKNDGKDHPVIWASSTLRGLGQFAPQSLSRVPAVNPSKALRALAGTVDFAGRAIAPPTSFSKVDTPTQVIFAGNGPRALAARLAVEFVAESTSPPGRWRFTADANTGDILDVEDLIVFEAVGGTVAGNVTQGAKAMDCANEVPTSFPYAELGIVGGGSAFADVGGAFQIQNPGTDAVTVSSLIGGQYFDVTDITGTNEQLQATVVPPGPVALLHNAGNESDLVRAEVNGYVHANSVRDFLLSYVPNYPVISTQINFPVNVNRTDVYCPGNAWYDYSSINFCVGSTAYSNTSFESVNHHEYGHHIVTSGGSGQGAYGEGMSDVVAMLFSGDPGLGYGFYLNQCSTPLRTADNDCQYSAASCSSCGSEAHACGNLISGTIWDMRLAFAAAYPDTYVELVNELVLSSIPMHTGTGIDSSIAIDLLTLDDDDGNLDNGTPHYAQICAGFTAHGMSCPPVLEGLGLSGTELVAEGPTGGPFAPESVTYTVTNLGPDPVLDYSVGVVGGVPWVDILNGQGQLELGEQAQVTVAIDQAEAALLANGPHQATVQFTNLTDGLGNTTRPVKLEVGVPGAIYEEDFEEDSGGFTLDDSTTNLWHRTAVCASTQPGHSAPNSLFFGLDATCNYNNGVSTGTITSPAVVVNDTTLVKLRFNYFLETERSGNWDAATAQVSVNDGAYVTVASNKAGTYALQDGTASWQRADVDITSLVAGLSSATLRLRFGFNTVDGVANTYAGFLVDDVQVRAFAEPCTGSEQCDDGAFCNGLEQCTNGVCTGGTPVVCDDGVACTADSCNEATDACASAPNSGLCDDGVVCNGTETCSATGCQAGTPLDCNDGNACTADSCNPAVGCQNTAITCNDGNACTADSCTPATGCQATSITCNDGNECTTDSCNPTSGCSFQNSTGACTDDGNSCTTDVCSAGTCTHPDNGTCSSNAFVESGGLVVMEAEHFHTTAARANHAWTSANDANASGGALVTVTPNNNTNINTGYTTGSPELGFKVKFTTTGTYHVWLRGSGATADDDSAHAGINGTGPASADRISSFNSSLTWSKSTMDGPVATIVVSTPGVHTINIWMREDGFRLDKIVLTTNANATYSGAGPAESPKDGGGSCTSNANCNDNNPCTNDTCSAGTCTYTNNTASCADDGNVCTNDVCSAGACTHPNNTASCADDGSSCTNDVCSAGVCTHPDNGSCGGTGACSGRCTNPVIFNQSYQSGNLGTAATCHQTTANLAGGNCGNFAAGRTLTINGVTMTCNNGNWSSLPAKSNGGYCVQTTAGNHPWAYFTTW